MAEELNIKLLGHLFKKRNWSNKEQVKKDVEKDLNEMTRISDKI